jgi:ParB family chromosome partitioning protein
LIKDIQPAAYNPREITEEGLIQLRKSLRILGFVKPIIVRDTGLLVAGHQRTKAAQLEGLTECPAFVIAGMNPADEIRFNQIHNGCEIDLLAGDYSVPGGDLGFHWIQPRQIIGPDKPAKGAAERHEMLKLLAKYGHFGAAIATTAGKVIAGQLYASCCRVLGFPLLVRYVDADRAEDVARFLGQSYGQYSYRNLPRNTWHQAHAQMNRLAGESNMKSTLYERVVIPNLRPGMRVLDFGAGKMAYADKLRSLGHDITAVEFYRKRGGSIDVRQVQRDIDALIRSLTGRGRFDFVVCDSVLNSVDSEEAEASVMGCLNAFCRPGGLIAFSGRPIGKHGDVSEADTKRHGYRQIEFLDNEGYSAIYRAGSWQYQKFHTATEVKSLADQFVGADAKVTCGDKARGFRSEMYGTSWQVFGSKEIEIGQAQAIKAITFEFDLSHPGGSYGRGADVSAAWLEAISREAAQVLVSEDPISAGAKSGINPIDHRANRQHFNAAGRESKLDTVTIDLERRRPFQRAKRHVKVVLPFVGNSAQIPKGCRGDIDVKFINVAIASAFRR